MGDELHFLSYGEGRIKGTSMYPVRKSGHCELLWLKNGCLYICEGYREYRMTTGEIVLSDGSSGCYGFRESGRDSDFVRISFSCDGIQKLAPLFHRQLLLPDSKRFSEISELIRIYCGMPEYPSEAIDNLVRLALTELFVYAIPQKDSNPDKVALCDEICTYIRERNGVVKSSEIAAKFGYTQKYLSTVFSSRYSRGLKSYIDSVRLANLKLSLSSDMTPAEAAEAAGFNDVKQMQDFFRYSAGMTVSDWLNEH